MSDGFLFFLFFFFVFATGFTVIPRTAKTHAIKYACKFVIRTIWICGLGEVNGRDFMGDYFASRNTFIWYIKAFRILSPTLSRAPLQIVRYRWCGLYATRFSIAHNKSSRVFTLATRKTRKKKLYEKKIDIYLYIKVKLSTHFTKEKKNEFYLHVI